MEYEQEYQAYEESGNIPEVAEPDITEQQTEDYETEGQTEEIDTEEQQKEQTEEPQSKEQNAHYAQQRRQQEMEQLRQQAYQQAQTDFENKQYATWAEEQGIQGINSKSDYELWEQSQQQNVPYELMQKISGMEQMMQQTMQEKQRLEYESTIKAQEQSLMQDGDYGDLFKSHEQDIRNIAYSAGVDLNTALAVFLMQDQGRSYFRQLKEQTKKEAQAETVRNITSNKSTPGALSTEKAGLKSGIGNMSDTDFDKLYEAAKRGEISQF
jgi:hypothetical protein